MSKAPKANEARDVMLSELLICIQAAPQGDRHKFLAAVKSFLSSQQDRKTSLSRFVARLVEPPPEEKEAAEKEDAKATKAPKAAPKAPAQAKKKKTG